MNKMRILIIDDNEAIHESFAKIFAERNENKEMLELSRSLFENTTTNIKEESEIAIELNSAYQGQEGVEMVQKSIQDHMPYVLAFVDIRMPPGLDGIETIAKIWELDPNIKMVICTAHSDYALDDMRTKLNNSKNFLVLKKPFDVIEIQQIVHAFAPR